MLVAVVAGFTTMLALTVLVGLAAAEQVVIMLQMPLVERRVLVVVAAVQVALPLLDLVLTVALVL
jgi:hypothetical protein